MERSQEEKILGGLTHVAAIFSWIGVIANIILFVVYREKSAFVAAHAKQGLGLSAIGLIGSWILGALGAGSVGLLSMGSLGAAAGMAMILGLVAMVWGIGILVLAILAAIKGFKGEEHRYPLFGEMVAKIGG